MCAANPAAGVTVTCNKTEAGGDWPDRPFTVTVNATGGPAGCKSSDEDSAAITVDVSPVITVKVDDANVCEDSEIKTLEVELTSTTTDPLTIQVTPAYCKPAITTVSEYQAAATVCLLD